MDKLNYERAQLEIVEFRSDDVIITSGEEYQGEIVSE